MAILNTAKMVSELKRRYKSPGAVLRQLGLDESYLEGKGGGSGSGSVEQARQQLCDMIENLDDSAVVEFAETLRNMAGDSRGLRKAARDQREREDRGLTREGEDARRRTADSMRSRVRDARRFGRDDDPNDGPMMQPPMAGDAAFRSLTFEDMFGPAAARIRNG